MALNFRIATFNCEVEKYTNGSTKAFDSVQQNGPNAAASDHGAVWAEFVL